jgi:hypothetical protein
MRSAVRATGGAETNGVARRDEFELLLGMRQSVVRDQRGDVGASSVDSARRNLRRAGVLKKRSLTAMVVPRGNAASSTRWILPPATSMRVPGGFFSQFEPFPA